MTGNLGYGMLGLVVYLSSPMIFQHTFCLSLRPISLFLVSIVYIISSSFSIVNFSALSILIAVILLLHKFAAQVVVFLTPAFLIIGRPDYLTAVAVGFLIAMLVSKGYYLKVLRAHVAHLRTNYLKQWARKSAQNPLRRTAALVVYCPWLAFFAISVFVLGGNVFSTSFLVCTSAWIITLITLSVITNFSVLKNIGEGWRYLGYLVFPMSFFAVYAIENSAILPWVYTFVAVLGFIIDFYYTSRLYRQHKRHLIDKEDVSILKKISSIKGKEIIAYPDEFTLAAAYFSEKDHAIDLEFADVIAVNRKLVEESLPKTLEEKGYSLRLEEKRWSVYSR
jgi:hypothetical protein